MTDARALGESLNGPPFLGVTPPHPRCERSEEIRARG
jgi:hypothetical protein